MEDSARVQAYVVFGLLRHAGVYERTLWREESSPCFSALWGGALGAADGQGCITFSPFKAWF